MQAIINPGHISGVAVIPPSKSIFQRACAAALLHRGRTIINNPGTSADDNAALEIIQQCGAEVFYAPESNNIEIVSNGVQPLGDTIHCGESGLSARLFIPIAALCNKDVTITGAGSLLHRPMKEYLDVLPQLGVSVLETNDSLPLAVRGPLHPKDITIDGSLSSQFLTGLLTAFAFSATEPVTISVTNLKSKPYVDLTLHMLQQFGAQVEHNSYRSFTIQPNTGTATHTPIIQVEADWSAAANFIVANGIGADVWLKGMNEQSLQADRAIMDIVRPGNPAFEYDATDSPDLLPALAIYAAQCNGLSKVAGLHRLVHKESNRIDSIATMLQNFGIQFSIDGDSLCVQGGQPFSACTIDSFNDHRIVMAAAIAALKANGTVVIQQAEAVNKSYPHFFETLKMLGADCYLVH